MQDLTKSANSSHCLLFVDGLRLYMPSDPRQLTETLKFGHGIPPRNSNPKLPNPRPFKYSETPRKLNTKESSKRETQSLSAASGWHDMGLVPRKQAFRCRFIGLWA